MPPSEALRSDKQKLSKSRRRHFSCACPHSHPGRLWVGWWRWVPVTVVSRDGISCWMRAKLTRRLLFLGYSMGLQIWDCTNLGAVLRDTWTCPSPTGDVSTFAGVLASSTSVGTLVRSQTPWTKPIAEWFYSSWAFHTKRNWPASAPTSNKRIAVYLCVNL